ncbi:DgyrCDS3330 [Dimorphilus gyrociliatus]|uniref:DgyrCDS3330 n=1 Tax=Dimorphilus gyrociliatus TaxID=2664684 RepID=A0A7I8VHZ3_9ANNE|nr:DgyrCDS3330 [Dimorphilus gyrociliatus]
MDRNVNNFQSFIASQFLPQHPQAAHLPAAHQYAPVQSSPIDLTRPIPAPQIPPYRTSVTPEPRRLDYYTPIENRVPSAPLPAYGAHARIPIIHITPENHHFGRTVDPKVNYSQAQKDAFDSAKGHEAPSSNNYQNKPLLTSLLMKKDDSKSSSSSSKRTAAVVNEKTEKRVEPEKKKTKDSQKSHQANIPLEEEKYKFYNKRQMILNNIPSPTMSSHLYNKHQEHAINRASAGSITDGDEIFEAIRVVVQKLFDDKLNSLVKEFQNSIINLAVANMKINLKATDDQIEQWMNSFCRNLLENSKRLYPVKDDENHTIADVSDSSTSDISENKSVRARKKQLFEKRSRRVSPSPSPSIEKIPKKKKKVGRPLLHKLHKMKEVIVREGRLWEPENLTTETHFLMGAKANKALGYGATRGRMYIKHPDIFKYCADSDDKVWLHQQKLMPATGGRAYLVLQEDVDRIVDMDEYKDLDKTDIRSLAAFSVPDWMISKMRFSMESAKSSNKRGRSKGVFHVPSPVTV